MYVDGLWTTYSTLLRVRSGRVDLCARIVSGAPYHHGFMIHVQRSLLVSYILLRNTNIDQLVHGIG